MNTTIYTVTVTKEQLDTLAGFLDAAVKSLGIGCVPKAAEMLALLESAKELTEPKLAKLGAAKP